MTRPRLGFLGAGWIGLKRLESVAVAGGAQLVAVADPSAEARDAAQRIAPEAEVVGTFEELLEHELDGIVIATPTGLHAEQCLAALREGMAVFCQKPLARTAAEVREIVSAARGANLLLAADMSYRETSGLVKLREAVGAGALGKVYGGALVFHNAYGPSKAWCRDPPLAGGGCVADLGVHLVDAALWVLGFPEVEHVESRLFAGGAPLAARDAVEDFAVARLHLAGGTALDLACSWWTHLGQGADIRVEFHGTSGGAAFRNAAGSFFDFTAESFRGTDRQVLASAPEDWTGRAILRWVADLAESPRYRPQAEEYVPVAAALDAIYAAQHAPQRVEPAAVG